MIECSCAGCGQAFNVKDEWAGKRARCKKCGATVEIPGGVEEMSDDDLLTEPKARIAEVPRNHAIFDSFFKIDFDKLTAYRTGGVPGYFGVFEDNDVRKRVKVIINYNQDIGDYWEWSDRGFNVVPSNEAYKLGVNYLIYALTH